MFPDELRVSSFPNRFPHYAWKETLVLVKNTFDVESAIRSKRQKPGTHLQERVFDEFPSDRRLCVVKSSQSISATNKTAHRRTRQKCSSQPMPHTGESQGTLHRDGQNCVCKRQTLTRLFSLHIQRERQSLSKRWNLIWDPTKRFSRRLDGREIATLLLTTTNRTLYRHKKVSIPAWQKSKAAKRGSGFSHWQY